MVSLPIALTPKKTLLIGAGSVAMQKHKVLSSLNWEVHVVAREKTHPYFEDFEVFIRQLDASDGALFAEFSVIIDESGDQNENLEMSHLIQ